MFSPVLLFFFVFIIFADGGQGTEYLFYSELLTYFLNIVFYYGLGI